MGNNEYSQGKHFDFIRCPQSLWPNKLLNFNVGDGEWEDVLQEIERKYANGNIPGQMMLDAGQELPPDIISSGRFAQSTWTAMTHDLRTLPVASDIAELDIRLITTDNDLQVWLDIVEAELMKSPGLSKDLFSALLAHQNCYFFLGYYLGEPVATSLLFMDEDVAGIYLVATAESHRKLGIGRELTRICLEKASETGCKLVHLQATNAGRGVYQALGFIDEGPINVYRLVE